MRKISLELAATAAFLASAGPALAQRDVAEFSVEDAEDLLAGDKVPDSAACDEAAGTCRTAEKTRGFTFVRPINGEARPKSQPKSAITQTRPASTPGTSGMIATRPAASKELPLQFKLGSYALSAQSRANLRNLGTVMNNDANRAKRIRITGHTDKSGSLEVNQRLSQQRADAAADYLAEVGVDRTRIEAAGRAYEDVLPGESPYDPRNRRIEVERID